MAAANKKSVVPLRAVLHSTMGSNILSVGRLLKDPDIPQYKDLLQIKLRPFVHDQHHSYLELAITVHWTDEQENQRTASSYYRFVPGNLDGEIQITEIVDRTPADIRQLQLMFPHVSADELFRWLSTSEHQYWRLVLRHKPGHPYASNLFNAVRYGQPIDDKLDAIRAHLTSDTIQEFTMLVAATDLQGMIQLLNDRFMTERALCPLDNFYDNRAQYIQLGQLKKPMDRPSYKLGRVLSYQSFQEYYTLQGYGIVQEYEFNNVTDGPAICCDFRIMQLHANNDTIYLAFMTEIDKIARFQPDTQLQVGFTRIRDQDFHARVTEPFIYAGLNDTTLILTRPFDKETGKYLDLNLGKRVFTGDFKTSAKARHTIANARPRKAEIRVDSSDTVVKRQLSSLRELQKYAPDEIRQLLQANRFDSLQRYNAFETLGDRATELINRICSQFNADQRQVIDLLKNLPGGLGLVIGPPGTGKTYVITRISMMFMLSDPMTPIQELRPHQDLGEQDTTTNLPPAEQTLLDGNEADSETPIKEENWGNQEDAQDWEGNEADNEAPVEENWGNQEDAQEWEGNPEVSAAPPSDLDADTDAEDSVPFEFDDLGADDEPIQPLTQKEQWIDSDFSDEEGEVKKDGPRKRRPRHRMPKPPKPRQIPPAPKKHQILITAPLNTAVDDIANELREYGKQVLPKDRELMVIRYHSWGSERSVIQRGFIDTSKPNATHALYEMALVDMQDIRFVKESIEHIQAANRYPHHGVNDKRVQLLRESHGYWMLRIAGFYPSEPCQYTDPQLFRDALCMIREYNEGHAKDWTNEDRFSFGNLLKELRTYAFSVADIVVTTLSNAADFKLYSAFQPILIFCDEAGKAIEADSWSLLIRYPYARGVVLVGDSHQLRPITLAGDQGNCFDSVIGQALFTRLETGGLNAVLLGTQHRFNSEINALISSIFYHNRLKAHQSCDARPTRFTLHSFNHKRFGIRSSIIFISAVNSNSERLGNSSSKHNETNLVIAMHLVEDLIRAKFDPKTIGILCPYQAQYSLYQKAINHLQHRYSKWQLSELLVQKFDGFQGGERSIIIADLVVDKYPGFLTQPNRLNVALSRARDALYIIGQVDAYEHNKNLRTSALMKIVTHCKLNKYDTIDDRTDTSAYYSILASAREEPCPTAGGDSEDEDVGVDDSKDEDVSADDSEDKDVDADDSEDEDVDADDSEDEYVDADDSEDEYVDADNSKDEDAGADDSEDKDVGADDSGDEDVGADDSAGENDPDQDSNTNQETIISDQVPNNKDTLAVSDAGYEGTEQTIGNIPSPDHNNHPTDNSPLG